jgi:hypothetical protein
VLKRAAPELLPDWLLEPFGRGHAGFMDQGEYPWRPIWPEPSPRFAVYFELANRIAYLQRLADSSYAHRHEALRWLDRYVPAAVYMTRSGNYELSADELVDTPCWPAPACAADTDCLPDIAMHVLMAPQCGSDREPPFSHPADHALADVLKKADCSPCRSRGYVSIVKKRLEQEHGNYLYDAIARIALVGLLGAQPEAGVPACFRLRFKLHEWYSFCGSDRNALLTWIQNNPMLLTYAMREHVFAVSKQLPAFERYMAVRRRWHAMRRNAYGAMDDERAMLNDAHRDRELLAVRTGRGFLARPEPPPDLVSPLSDYNERNLRISPRPMTDSVCEKMRKTFAAIDKDLGPLPEPGDEEIRSMDEIDELLHAYEPQQRFPYELLHRHFAVSYESVEELAAAEEAFVQEVERTRVRRALLSVRRRSARDYRLLRAYFDSLRKAVGLVFFDLPFTVSRRQLEGLRRLYGVNPGEELPSSAGVFLVCPNCTFFKADVNHDGSRRGHDVRIPIMDALSQGKIYCRRLVPRQQASNKGRSAARQEKKKRDDDSCKYSELIKVSMVGRSVWSREQKACIFMCPDCAQLCTHGRHSFVNGELNCGCEYKPEKKMHCCSYCRARKEKPKWLIVADDRARPVEIKAVPFCDKHYPRWSASADAIETLSDIKRKLERKTMTTAREEDEEGEEIDARNAGASTTS